MFQGNKGVNGYGKSKGGQREAQRLYKKTITRVPMPADKPARRDRFRANSLLPFYL